MIDDTTREAIVRYRIDNALNTLNEIQILIDNELWNTAVSRLYYACYYAVSALLISIGVETHSHSAVRTMLSMHYTKTGKLSISHSKFYADLFSNRQSSDYADFVYFDRDTVEILYEQAKEFVEAIRALI